MYSDTLEYDFRVWPAIPVFRQTMFNFLHMESGNTKAMDTANVHWHDKPLHWLPSLVEANKLKGLPEACVESASLVAF